MKAAHWAGVVLACLMALAPVLVPELPSKAAALAPAVLAVAAILKHASDASEGESESKQEPPK
jgi:hypothetical protein